MQEKTENDRTTTMTTEAPLFLGTGNVMVGLAIPVNKHHLKRCGTHETKSRTDAQHSRKQKERRAGGAAAVAHARTERARFEVRGAV